MAAAWRDLMMRVRAMLLTVLLCGCNQIGTVDRLPDDADGLHARSQILMERGQVEDAIEVLSLAIDAAPSNTPDLLTDRGIAHEAVGEIDAAEADYTAAIAADGSSIRALNNRAAIYARAGQLEEAVADLTRVIEKDDSNLLAHQNRSLAQFQLGQLEAALVDIKRADYLVPGNPVHLYRRGQILATMGDAEAALQSLDGALLLAEDAGVTGADVGLMRAERARVLQSLGRTEEAVEDFYAAAELNPTLGAEQEAKRLIARNATQAALLEAGHSISEEPASEGIEFVVDEGGVMRPVLVVSSISADEFRLSDVQIDLLGANPLTLIAIVDLEAESATLMDATDLASDDYRAESYAVRVPRGGRRD